MHENRISPAQEGKINGLLHVGFERVGNSEFYETKDFVVSVDSSARYQLFVDFSYPQAQSIQGLKRHRLMENGRFALVIWSDDQRRGEEFLKLTLDSFSSIWEWKPNRDSFQGSLSEQLEEAGFVKDPKERTIFRQTFEERGRSYKIIAMVEDGKVRRLLRPIDTSIEDHIDESTLVTDYRAKMVTRGPEEKLAKVLTLSNSLMSFDIIAESGGVIAYGSQKLHRSITLEDLQVHDISPIEEESGFIIGGINTSDQIRTLQQLVGTSIEDLEAHMKPGRDSMAGFLGEDESLLEVLAQDNDFVLSHGLTHQELAKQLKFAEEVRQRGLGNEFEYNGRRYHIKVMQTRGYQRSPFDDGTKTDSDIRITNLTNGATLRCSCLLKDMIERYGFYEGRGTGYRLEPADILEVFDFLKET